MQVTRVIRVNRVTMKVTRVIRVNKVTRIVRGIHVGTNRATNI
jgi:hypothetical protein